MADVITSNLELRKQEVGANENTWGDLLNATLQLIDDGWGKTATVNTTGGTTALTDSEEIVHRIAVTGILVSNAILEFTGRGGRWIVDNGTTGAYTVTVKISGQTGVVVPQGATRLVFYNGTDIEEIGASGLQSGNNLSDVASATASATSLGLGTGNTPLFAGVNIGAADTTISRVSAGQISVEGIAVLLANDIGVTVQGYDADTLKRDVTALLTVGFTVTPYNFGSKTTGTFTPSLANGQFQYGTNDGAHAIGAPAADGSVVLHYTNGVAAGALSFSGFTVGTNTGDALTTTSGHQFRIYIDRINGVSTYTIKALQ